MKTTARSTLPNVNRRGRRSSRTCFGMGALGAAGAAAAVSSSTAIFHPRLVQPTVRDRADGAGDRAVTGTIQQAAQRPPASTDQLGQAASMFSVAALASSSPFTNAVASVQNAPEPTSAGIWSEPSKAAGSAVFSVSRNPCSSSDQLAGSALLLPVRKPELPPPTRLACAC